MPRPQVYGKRSRAIFNANHAIFDSPERKVPAVREYGDGIGEATARKTEYNDGTPLRTACHGIRAPLDSLSINSTNHPKVEGRTLSQRKLDGNCEAPKCNSPITSASESREGQSAVPRRRSLEPKTNTDALDYAARPLAANRAVTDASSHQEVGTVAERQGSVIGGDLSGSDGTERHYKGTSPTSPSGQETGNVYIEHCAPLLALSTHKITTFASWSEQLAPHFSITKIAEASFGEVYRLSLLHNVPGLATVDESVFKVIALQPPPSLLPTAKKARAAALKKAESMSRPEQVANETRLLQRMDSIPGFTLFRDVRVLQGRPTQPFIDAWEAFNVEQKARNKDLSIFPNPSKKTSYGADQLWAVIEMQDAGMDLERFIETGQCVDAFSTWDIFWQVVLSLAKGEEAAEFEHRDLHLGNICVRRMRSESYGRGAAIDGEKKLGFTDLETTLIDYTISRCLLSASTNEVAFQDLAHDPHIFAGNAETEYQYEIYRHMRAAMYLGDPLSSVTEQHTATAAKEQAWRQYHPITNLVWLHFVLHELLKQLDRPSAKRPPPKTQKQAYAEWRRASDLEHKLLKVQTLLDPAKGLCKDGLRSASDLVALALTEGWLDVEDVVGDVAGEAGEEAEPNGVYAADTESDEVTDQFTHLRINVAVIEEHGLEVAEHEARSERMRSRRRKK